jgi:hypothetical protein
MSFIPDLFVIGAMKAGTSTVWKGAFENEKLSPSQNKEVNFFLDGSPDDKLETLYKGQFSKPDRIKIDVSPNYSRRHLFPGVADRIYRANPNAKILYLVRNPIDRIVSHLHHDMFRDRINKNTMNERLFQNEDYTKTSSYFFQLEDYLAFFKKSQILILQMERMKSDPEGFCSEFASFLNLPYFKLPKKSYNLSGKRYLIKYHDAFHRYFPLAPLGNLYHYFWYVINIKVERPQLTSSQIKKIRDILEPDSIRLSNEFGIDIGNWYK